MAEHSNVAIIRRAYEAFAKADLDGALGDLPDDCVFHFRPSTKQRQWLNHTRAQERVNTIRSGRVIGDS